MIVWQVPDADTPEVSHDGRVKIIGVEVPGGAAVFSCDLPHGADPYRLTWEHGYGIVRPLSASGAYPDLALTVQVRRHGRHIDRHVSPHVRAAGMRHADTLAAEPVARQRLAAYAIITSRRGLLATQFSHQTAVPGLWGLPGGGIDPGEAPSQTVMREVMEETSQHLEIDHLLDLQTDHWIGRSPAGIVEDFHAVRIIYAGRVPEPTDPEVIDIGGTTSTAAWVPLADWRTLPWSQSARLMIDRHLEALTRHVNDE